MALNFQAVIFSRLDKPTPRADYETFDNRKRSQTPALKLAAAQFRLHQLENAIIQIVGFLGTAKATTADSKTEYRTKSATGVAMGRGKKYGFSFSWKRASGLSAAKGKVSRKTGIPLSRSGRQRKVGRQLGCCVPFTVFIVGAVTAYVLFA